MRKAEISRITNETKIDLLLIIDGTGIGNIDTGIPFFDHMLMQLSKHGIFDLQIIAKGDIGIDAHHLIEDTGIALGEAFAKAMENKKGINRYGHAYVPMDEALAFVSLDYSNRPFSVIRIPWNGEYIGHTSTSIIPTSLFEHFFQTFATNAKITLHLDVKYGRDNHHMIEAAFKALARALDEGSRIDSKRSNQLPSTKGLL